MCSEIAHKCWPLVKLPYDFFGFDGNHFEGPKDSYWSGHSWKHGNDLRDEVIITSGLTETILRVLNTPVRMLIAESMIKVWNQVEVSIRDEIITTSGLVKVILKVLNTYVGVVKVEKMISIWNKVDMSIWAKL